MDILDNNNSNSDLTDSRMGDKGWRLGGSYQQGKMDQLSCCLFFIKKWSGVGGGLPD